MNKNDILLMEGAYNSIVLRSQLANLTVKQLGLVIENASTYELEVIEELFGGMKNLFSAGKKGLESAGNTIKGAAKGVGRAVAAGAGQVGKNAKDIYQTGEKVAETKRRRGEVAKSISKIAEQLRELKVANPDMDYEIDDIFNMTIEDIYSIVRMEFGKDQIASDAAVKTGFFGGAGTAAVNAYKNA